MTIDIPAHIADLTARWLDDALREGGQLDVAVDRIEVEPLGAAAGLLGDLARLRVWYTRGAGPDSFIVKLPATDPGGHRVGSMLRAWSREVAFYREVAPRSPGAKVPRCYHAAADEAARRWVVVLEDCAADPVDFLAGATRHQAIVAVDALAAFHGTWWEAPAAFEWMPSVTGDGFAFLQAAWLDAIPRFLHRYQNVLPEPTAEWLMAFAPRLADWAAGVATEPLTIVHADYRLDNLIFGDDRVTMIDWQTALRGPGAMDLTCFLATSLTTDDRRRFEDDLIGRYLDRLASSGTVVDRRWFSDSYDRNLLWWMGQFANNLSGLEPEDTNVQLMLETMVVRTYTAALDRDVGRLL